MDRRTICQQANERMAALTEAEERRHPADEKREALFKARTRRFHDGMRRASRAVSR